MADLSLIAMQKRHCMYHDAAAFDDIKNADVTFADKQTSKWKLVHGCHFWKGTEKLLKISRRLSSCRGVL